MVYVPYVMPGFDLARTAAACFRKSRRSACFLASMVISPGGRMRKRHMIALSNRPNGVELWFAENVGPWFSVGRGCPPGSTGKRLCHDCVVNSLMTTPNTPTCQCSTSSTMTRPWASLSKARICRTSQKWSMYRSPTIRIKPFPMITSLGGCGGPA